MKKMVFVAMAILVLAGCTPSRERSLKESFSLANSKALESQKGVFEVRGNWVHSALLQESEEGQVFTVAVRKGEELYKVEACCFDPKSESLIAYLPEEMKGARVVFISHDGKTFFGEAEYYVEYSEEEPDWKNGIEVEEGKPGVRLLKADTPERKAASESYLSAQKWLSDIVQQSPSLKAEIHKEEIAPYTRAFMVITRVVWSLASFGWGRAVNAQSLYDKRGWKDIWRTANYSWSLEKVFQIMGIDLTEYWEGHLASSTPSRRETCTMMRRRDVRRLFRTSEEQQEYEACLKLHFSDRRVAVPEPVSAPSPEPSSAPSGQPSGSQAEVETPPVPPKVVEEEPKVLRCENPDCEMFGFELFSYKGRLRHIRRCNDPNCQDGGWVYWGGGGWFHLPKDISLQRR